MILFKYYLKEVWGKLFVPCLVFYSILSCADISYVPQSCRGRSQTHQAQKDTEELDHICICNRVKSSNKGIEDGYQC